MSNKVAEFFPLEESKRWGLLCKVYAKALSNWELLLTQPVQNVDTFKKAFRAVLAKHPEAIEVATSGGMLQYVMKREFPTLAAEAPESFDVLIKDVVAGFKSAAQAEFTDFFRDLGLEAKLVDLESREAALRAGGEVKDMDRPEPLALQPEEEMRTVVVESLLSHEAQLTQELERLRRDNSSLEEEVGVLSARSKAVATSSASLVSQLKAAADAARVTLEKEEASRGAAAQ